MNFIITKIDGKSTLFLYIYFRNAIKMGNTPSKPLKKGYNPIQGLKEGIHEYSIPFNQKIPIKDYFLIEAQPQNEDRINIYDLYHIDSSGTITLFFNIETRHELRNKFNVVYNGSIVNFVFETDTFEKGLKPVLKFAFDFSKSFDSEENFYQQLKSIPDLLPSEGEIFFLKGKYWYYVNSIENIHEFRIVESVDDTSSGFMSVFKNGDCVIQIITVESKNLPFVMDDGEGNHFIVSKDNEFDPIQIILECDIKKITHLVGKYWYLVKFVNWSYVFYILELSDETAREFKSITKSRDTVVNEIFVKSSNVPYVTDENGNFFIACADEEFVQIPIQLPTLAQPSSQQTFP
jgi:hypothetical protein